MWSGGWGFPSTRTVICFVLCLLISLLQYLGESTLGKAFPPSVVSQFVLCFREIQRDENRAAFCLVRLLSSSYSAKNHLFVFHLIVHFPYWFDFVTCIVPFLFCLSFLSLSLNGLTVLFNFSLLFFPGFGC